MDSSTDGHRFYRYVCFTAWVRRRWRVILFIFVVLPAVLAWAGIWFAKSLLVSESPLAKADAIVLLGGDVTYRPNRAAQLYQQSLAPRIIATGWRDCQEMRTALIGAGVPGEAIETECASRSTKQNAQFTIPLLRAVHARRAIIVTSWYHSRRALHCFQHYAPDIEFISAPTVEDRPTDHWPQHGEFRLVAYELFKTPGYWVFYGVPP